MRVFPRRLPRMGLVHLHSSKFHILLITDIYSTCIHIFYCLYCKHIRFKLYTSYIPIPTYIKVCSRQPLQSGARTRTPLMTSSPLAS